MSFILLCDSLFCQFLYNIFVEKPLVFRETGLFKIAGTEENTMLTQIDQCNCLKIILVKDSSYFCVNVSLRHVRPYHHCLHVTISPVLMHLHINPVKPEFLLMLKVIIILKFQKSFLVSSQKLCFAENLPEFIQLIHKNNIGMNILFHPR